MIAIRHSQYELVINIIIAVRRRRSQYELVINIIIAVRRRHSQYELVIKYYNSCKTLPV